MDWGSFAGGMAKTWNPSVIGGAINQGLLNSDIQAADDALSEDTAALEHLKNAQASEGSKKVSDDWVKKQQDTSQSDHKQAIKTAYTKWRSPEAYNNYLRSEAEGSQASFQKYITDGKQAFAKELRDLRGNKEAMVGKAVEMGMLPQGSAFDAKAGTLMVPDAKGNLVAQPVTDDQINAFMDAYELAGWRRFATGIDEFNKGSESDVALRTRDARVANANLAPQKTAAEINSTNARTNYTNVLAREAPYMNEWKNIFGVVGAAGQALATGGSGGSSASAPKGAGFKYGEDGSVLVNGARVGHIVGNTVVPTASDGSPLSQQQMRSIRNYFGKNGLSLVATNYGDGVKGLGVRDGDGNVTPFVVNQALQEIIDSAKGGK